MAEAGATEWFQTETLLADLDAKARTAVLGALVEERGAAGSILLRQGQPNDHLSFLIEGSASIERARIDGRSEILATLTAPSVFGTTSFFTPGAPTFSVRATSDVGLLTLYHPAHDRLRLEHPAAAEALAVALIGVLSERFNELDRAFSDYVARHPEYTEWASFRARLFEEPSD